MTVKCLTVTPQRVVCECDNAKKVMVTVNFKIGAESYANKTKVF